MIDSIVILAAGNGNRMLPLTKEIPKAMVEFNGRPLISYSLQLFKDIPNKYVTIGCFKNLLKRYLEGRVSNIIDTEGNGNSWWIYNSQLKNLDEPLFVSVCDSILNSDFNLNSLSEDYKMQGSPAGMIVPAKYVGGIDGDFIKKDKENRIINLQRKNRLDIYGSGIQILNPAKINKITKSCDDFLEVWKQLIDKKQLYCSKVLPKKWVSIDSVENLKRFENFFN